MEYIQPVLSEIMREPALPLPLPLLPLPLPGSDASVAWALRQHALRITSAHIATIEGTATRDFNVGACVSALFAFMSFERTIQFLRAHDAICSAAIDAAHNLEHHPFAGHFLRWIYSGADNN
jgi:hypothetical protein